MSIKQAVLCIIILFCCFNFRAHAFSIMEFSNPYKYDWLTAEDRHVFRDSLDYKNSLLEEYEPMTQSPLTNALKTAIAPGWGHFSVGRTTKGQVFLGSQLVLLGASLYYYEQSMIHYRKYRKATQVDEIDKHYNDALIPFRQSNLFLGLFFVLWGYTIYDVVVETNSFNSETWDSLVRGEKNYSLIITPTGVALRF